MALRVVVCGIRGRMGREVVAAAADDSRFEVIGGTVRTGADPNGRYGARTVERLEAILPEADVVIDFTRPHATLEHAIACCAAGRPFVSGTTGLDAEQISRLSLLSEECPIFYARNMSLGIAALLQALPQLAQGLSGFDVEIVETHHRHKTDAPSGTALALAEAIAGAVGSDLDEDATYGRRGQAPRRPGEIGIHAVRGGGNAGEHTILFADEGEEIRIGHRSLSRRPFAAGALQAAAFLHGRPPGLYGMEDLLAAKRR